MISGNRIKGLNINKKKILNFSSYYLKKLVMNQNENKISKKQQQINKLEMELARYSTNARKRDTRKKILLGAFLLNKMNSDPNYRFAPSQK